MERLIKNILIMLLFAVGASQSYAEQKITFYHYDLLGSPVATTDENGDVIWREEYSPWGEKLLKEDEIKEPDNVRGYTGHVNDKETGLTYMQARYYDPQIGRFMGVDPVGFQENNSISFNRYNYANNNPYKFTDPNGETPLGEELDTLNEMEANDNAEKEAWAEILDDPEKQKAYIDNRIKNNVIGIGLMALGMTRISPKSGIAGSIRNVNPTHGKQNCVNCSIATDATLAGRSTSALPGTPASIAVLEKQFGGKFKSVKGQGHIESLLSTTGTRGIVFGARKGVGHVFNAVNQSGTVRFLDGQTGRAASFEGYTSFQFLRTK